MLSGQPKSNGEKIAAIAVSLAGKEFHQDQPAQCMAWVRSVLTQAGSELEPKITKQPVDGLSTSYYLASSLAGRDLGVIVDKLKDLTVGAIVFFNDTYSGPWPSGTITHVGIYVGNGQMVHHPTMARPTELVSLTDGYWASKFRCGLLIPEPKKVSASDLKEAPAPIIQQDTNIQRLKIFAHDGKSAVILNDKKTGSKTTVMLTAVDGKLYAEINGVKEELVAATVEIVTRNK